MAESVTRRYGSVKKARQALKGGGGIGPLRRLKADETVKVRFLQEPDDWEEGVYHWIGGEFLWCNRQKNCTGCKTGDRPRKIALANAVEIEKGKVVIMQMPPTLADQVLKRHEKFGTVMDRDYDLSREGSGQMDTKYSLDYDMPKKRNLSRYDLFDIAAEVLGEIGDDDGETDEEEDEPRSTKKSSVKRSSRRRDEEEDDEYEDEDDGDDEEEEEEDERPRRPVRRSVKKTPARRSRHEDEDDEEEEPEDERPTRTKKSRSGLDEFKPKKKTTGSRTVVRRAR